MLFGKTNDSLEIFPQEKYLHKTDHEDVRMTREDMTVKQKCEFRNKTSQFSIFIKSICLILFHVPCLYRYITSQSRILRVGSFKKANKQFS